MSREWAFRIQDMLDCIAHIERLVAGHEHAESFSRDIDAYRAAERNIEIIAEASKHIPHDVKAEHPSIPWVKIVATRNIISHLYDGVDEDVIWLTLNRNVPDLKRALEAILKKYSGKR